MYGTWEGPILGRFIQSIIQSSKKGNGKKLNVIIIGSGKIRVSRVSSHLIRLPVMLASPASKYSHARTFGVRECV